MYDIFYIIFNNMNKSIYVFTNYYYKTVIVASSSDSSVASAQPYCRPPDILDALLLDICTCTSLFGLVEKHQFSLKIGPCLLQFFPKIGPFSTLKTSIFLRKIDVLNDFHMDFSTKK